MDSIQQSLERKIRSIKKELSQAVSSEAKLKNKLDQSAKEVDHLRETLGEKEHTYRQEVEQLRRSLQQNEQQLRKKLETVNALFTEEQTKTKNLEGRCLESHDRAMKQIADLANGLEGDESSEKLLAAQHQISSLKMANNELKSEMDLVMHTHNAEVQRLQHACRVTHKDLNLILLEKKENEKTFAERCQMSMQENTLLSRKIEDLTTEIGLLKENSASENEVSQYKEQLSKERRRSAAYKGKAIEAHERSIKAKMALESLCNSNKQE